ncbi:hypothetical protein [Sodalis-like endosymbiont of Proechinophthirus fluctus]|nr:hypothetical protein [Sodalis-like endosymbiont of Proechinophthirus fluctus]
MGYVSLHLWLKFPNADGARFHNAEIRLRVPNTLPMTLARKRGNK